jgi:hypothetical protein
MNIKVLLIIVILNIFILLIAPEYVLCLQNGKFDQPDRMFNRYSIEKNVKKNPLWMKFMVISS